MPTAIDEQFFALHPTSAALHHEAASLFPDGVTHDVRYFEPFPIYVERAQGARKWDADDNEIIDFVMGHGALLFGHAHPLLVDAVQEQVVKGTHYGASQRGEIAWAQAIQALMPSAERVRFTASGTEATMMAVRLARAATGRDRLLRLRNHFHGWNDAVFAGAATGSGNITPAGLPAALAALTTVVDQHDAAAIRRELGGGDYAAVICEPTGYGWGACPLDPSMLTVLREATEASGSLLIFDEVVTGFRLAEGGVQSRHDIRPDLTALAKVLAGGMPGGAVVGRADLLDQIAIGGRDAGRAAAGRIAHPGTFNANPLSAAAGTAALRAVAGGEPIRLANARARQLCVGFNRAIREAELPGAAYGDASLVHVVLGQDIPPPDDDFRWNWDEAGPQATTPTTPREVLLPFRQSLVNHGVDFIRMGAIVSCVHSEADIDQAIDGFAAALSDLRRAGVL